MPRGRRAGTEGSVRQLPSGRWQARFPRSLDPSGRPVAGGPWPTEIQAKAALEQASEAVRYGRLRLASAPAPDPVAPRTAADAIEDLLTNAPGFAPHTISGYRSIARTVINQCPEIVDPADYIGQRTLEEITPTVVYAWRALLARGGVSPHKQRLAFRVLSSALSWEVEMGRLTINPCMGVRLRRTAQNTSTSERVIDTVQMPTWEEFHNIVTAIPDLDERIMVCVLGFCGPRFSEAAALEATNLLTATRRIKLEKQWVKPVGEDWQTTPLKSGQPREIPVPEGLWNHLQRLIPTLPVPMGDRAHTLWRTNPLNPNGGERGGIGVWTPSSFNKNVWVPNVREELGSPVRVKDLRAYAASIIVDAGATEAEAQKLLGHSDAAVTRKHYLRAQEARAYDPARQSLRIRATAPLPERLDALWRAWVRRFGDPLR